MAKITFFLLFFLFNLLAIFYLISPTPQLKELTNAARSDEPGDTIQLKNVSAYYTNLSRTEIINFYKANYSGLFRIILNHPPEKAKTIIRDTTQSYYLEEFILPFKESLFINGYEWENDVFTKPEKRIQNKLIFKGKEYKAKVTLKTFSTDVPCRLLTFFTIEIGIAGIYIAYKRFLRK
ncbi:MAG: hypothetical protein NTY75_03920 [Candidatus Shapirobacteria bacterium]|nr:hypothetical protein [Candidatus Shapirobacteria bacterium]